MSLVRSPSWRLVLLVNSPYNTVIGSLLLFIPATCSVRWNHEGFNTGYIRLKLWFTNDVYISAFYYCALNNIWAKFVAKHTAECRTDFHMCKPFSKALQTLVPGHEEYRWVVLLKDWGMKRQFSQRTGQDYQSVMYRQNPPTPWSNDWVSIWINSRVVVF